MRPGRQYERRSRRRVNKWWSSNGKKNGNDAA